MIQTQTDVPPTIFRQFHQDTPSHRCAFTHPRHSFAPCERHGPFARRFSAPLHSDAVWKLKLRDSAECFEEWTYLYLLLEFQSKPDPWMALRVQLYVGLLRQDLSDRKELTREALAPYQLGCRYWLIDEQHYEPQFLESQRSPLAALFRLEQCEWGEDADAAIGYLVECLERPENEGLRQDFFCVARWLLQRKIGDPSIANIRDLTEVQTMAMPIARTAQ